MKNGDSGNGEAHGPLGDDDPTKVEVSRDFIVGGVRRLAIGLHGAGRAVDAAGDLIASDVGLPAEPVLEDLDEYLGGLEAIVAGTRRALRRIREAHSIEAG